MRSTALSLHQYMPKFMTAARMKKKMAPPRPPMTPPRTTKSAVNPAMSVKTFTRCIRLLRSALNGLL